MPVAVESKLHSIETLLRKKINGHELWGDIDLKKEEYDALGEALAGFLQDDPSDIGSLCQRFPVCLTTFAVFLIRYEFNYNFWTLFLKKLGLPNTPANEVIFGTCILKAFEENGFDLSEAAGGRKYLDPIIYEAGLPPESNLGDLFYVLKYDTHSRFDPIGVIEDLLASRSYAIRRPMFRFLQSFRDDRAIDYVIEAHDAIRCVDHNAAGDAKYADRYRVWKETEQQRDKVSARKRQEFQMRPYLTFDDGRLGLCMVLPHTVLTEEWVDEVSWEIETDNGFRTKRRMTVFGSEGRRYVEQIMVPVAPAEEYTIRLLDEDGFGDKLADPYTVAGIPAKGVLMFNAAGRLIRPAYLPAPHFNLVCSDSVSISGTDIDTAFQSYPTGMNGYIFLTVRPTGRDAEFCCRSSEKPLILRGRPQAELCLSGATLFDMPQEACVFTELPIITVALDRGFFADDLFIRINNDARRIPVSEYLTEDSASIPMSKKDIPSYGDHCVRLYHGDRFLKQLEFSYVPKISMTGAGAISWQDALDRKQKKTVRFRKVDGWTMEFENCIVNQNETEYIVACPADIGLLRGVLLHADQIDDFGCRFTIPLRPAEIITVDRNGMIIDSATEKTVKLEPDTFFESPCWLCLEAFGDFAKKGYSLSLCTQNGTEQSRTVPFLRNGCVNIDLTGFSDTLRNCSLPAVFELWCEGEDKPLPLITVRKKAKFSGLPVYQPSQGNRFLVVAGADGRRDLILTKFSDGSVFRFSGASARFNQDRSKLGYPCSSPLPDGLYMLDVDTAEGSLFADEADEGFNLSSDTPMLLVRQHRIPPRPEDLSSWLVLFWWEIIHRLKKTAQQNVSSLTSIKQFSHFVRPHQNEDLSVNDLEILISLVYYASIEKVRWQQQVVLDHLRRFSRIALSGADRTQLIRLLLDRHCSQEIFSLCVQTFHLYLFSLPGDAYLLGEQLDAVSPELSLLMKMHGDGSIRTAILPSKYRELIGAEALRKMLIVQGTDDPSAVAREQRRFLREETGAQVTVRLSGEISGDMQPIQNMIVYNTKTPYLDMSKKPDIGIYFWQIRYVDQYLNWFKQNHDRELNLKQNTADAMRFAQETFIPDIVAAWNELKKKNGFIADYGAAIKKRYHDSPAMNLTSLIPARFFCVLGIASLLVQLPPEIRIPEEKRRSAEQFLCVALDIAPKMTKRDHMMAAVYLFLVRKEEKLCR